MKPSCLFLALLLLFSCGRRDADSQSGSTDEPAQPSDTIAAPLRAAQARTTKACPVAGTVQAGNHYLSQQQGLYVVISADSTTRHPKLGASHRVLEIYDSRNCQRLVREVLPVDRAADFPYALAEINYNNAVQLLAIRGTTQFYLYDLAQRALRGPFQPQFPSKRYGVDAQSGTIQQLEVWESYLIGYAQDYRAFVYQLNGSTAPTPVLPLAEYERETQVFHQAFLLPSAQGAQILLPAYERRTRTFRINPAFEQPIKIDEAAIQLLQDGRFLLLRAREPSGAPVVIDLQARQRLELPEEVQAQGPAAVQAWLEVQE